MRIFRHLADIPEALKGAVVAIGNFDGVHLGHRALIETAGRLARARGVPLMVMVFEPTPQDFFAPGAPPYRLTPFRAKSERIAALGADALIALPFDAGLAHLPASDFVNWVLVEGLAAQCVVVGEDFHFGAGRSGSAAGLAYFGEMEGFATEIVPPVMEEGTGEKISSSTIRRMLREAKPEAAAKLLGRPFAIEGRVAHGDARGRTIGFPTANVGLETYLRPAFGIYAVRAEIEGADDALPIAVEGVANLGIRPMWRIDEPLLEAFFFDFDCDIYERHIRVDLIGFLRPEIKFEGVEALVTQIRRDCDDAKAVLERNPRH